MRTSGKREIAVSFLDRESGVQSGSARTSKLRCRSWWAASRSQISSRNALQKQRSDGSERGPSRSRCGEQSSGRGRRIDSSGHRISGQRLKSISKTQGGVMSVTRRSPSPRGGGGRVPRSAGARKSSGVRDESIRRVLTDGRRSGSGEPFPFTGMRGARSRWRLRGSPRLNSGERPGTQSRRERQR